VAKTKVLLMRKSSLIGITIVFGKFGSLMPASGHEDSTDRQSAAVS
jgi:hypothetical protein